MTNAEAIAIGMIPCETNPENGRLSRTPEVFHGKAAVTIGSRADSLRHVCSSCREKHHKFQKLASRRVVWE